MTNVNPGVASSVSSSLVPVLYDPISGLTSANGRPVASSLGSLGFFDPRAPQRTITGGQENIALVGNVETTVFDYVGGPGIVQGFSFIGAGGNLGGFSKDSIVNVYVDGAGTPNISMQTHHWGTFGEVTPTSNFGRSTRRMGYAHQSDISGIMWFKYPIPFTSEVKITFNSVDGAMSNFWCTGVIALTSAYVGMNLYSSGRTYPNRLQTLTNSTLMAGTTLLATPKPAVLANLFLGFTNTTLQEANIAVYDGNLAPGNSPGPVPGWTSTGVEDFMLGAFYFGATLGVQTPHSYCVTGGGVGSCWVGDILELYPGGIATATSTLVRLEQGNSANPGSMTGTSDLFYNLLYYTAP